MPIEDAAQPPDDKMTIDERFKYLRIAHQRYAVAGRKERSHLLNDMEAMTGLNRKTLIRRMNGSRVRKRRRKQRGRIYGADVDDALRVIDDTFDHIAAERQTPNLVWMADLLAAHGELNLSPQLRGQLGRISISTVRRRLKRIHQDEPHLPRARPKRPNRLTRDIPMRRIPEAHPLERTGSRPLRGGSCSPSRSVQFRGICAHLASPCLRPANDRRDHRTERASGPVGMQLPGHAGRLRAYHGSAPLPCP